VTHAPNHYANPTSAGQHPARLNYIIFRSGFILI